MAWTELCYEYDGSFNGLLCCIFDSYTRRETPVSIRTAEQGQLSLEPVHTVETVASHAKRITKSLQARTPRALPLIQKAYLTCLPDKELYIYRLVQKLYREGPSFLKNPTDPVVYPLHTAVRHLAGELEKLRGFIRFSEFDGIYAAEIEPKNRVLPALRSHFCSRFADQPFLIYDRTHREILLYANGRWKISPLDSFTMARPGKTEAAYRKLWKTFYDTIAIRERNNPRCQRTHLPLRYRAVMTEFQNESFFQSKEESASAPSDMRHLITGTDQ